MAPMYGKSSKLVRLIPTMEQQRRIYAFYIEFCGDPTRWHIEERQCSCSFLYGWETAYRICGSVLFAAVLVPEDIGHTAFANLYGWETAKVFKFLRVFAAVLALQLVNE